MRNRKILILSVSEDRSNVERVVSRLTRSSPIIIELDRVLAGSVEFCLQWNDGCHQLSVAGEQVRLEDVVAGWWRKPHWVEVQHEDPLAALAIRREVLASAGQLEHCIDTELWLNAPSRMASSSVKFLQYRVAYGLGFSVPTTVTTNSWDAGISAVGTPAVFKLIDGSLWRTGGTQVAFTRRVSLSSVDPSFSPFPGLIQSEVTKDREWRVTVIDDQVLAARIDSSPADVDWRKSQASGVARFQTADIDQGLSRKCIDLVRRLGLRFAALDLIQDSRGVWWFLEANPNGQYGWLEDECGLPISDAIARSLER